jgi:hypothetical protein
MLHGRRNQDAHSDGHGRKGAGKEQPRCLTELCEPRLKGRIEMKAKQNLRAKNEQARFVESGLYLAIRKRHGLIVAKRSRQCTSQ